MIFVFILQLFFFSSILIKNIVYIVYEIIIKLINK